MCGTAPLRQPNISHTRGRYGSSLHSSTKCGVSRCKRKNMRWVDHWPYQFNICFFQMPSTVFMLRDYNKVFIYTLYVLYIYIHKHLSAKCFPIPTDLSRILNFNKNVLVWKKKKKQIFYKKDDTLKRKQNQNEYKLYNISSV